MAKLRTIDNQGQQDDGAPTMSSPASPDPSGQADQSGIMPGPNKPSDQGKQGPADRAGNNAVPGSPLSQPRTITPPSPEAQMGGSPNATPKMPSQPEPVAAQPPMPFQPTPAPQPMDLVRGPSIYGDAGSTPAMTGSQGGQLGGGMGVIGGAEGTGQAMPSDLLFFLTKLLSGSK